MTNNYMDRLLKRFQRYRESGENGYFDTNEIVSLIDHFSYEGDASNMAAAIEIGHTLHPDDTEIKIAIIDSFIVENEYAAALKLIESIDIEEGQNEILLAMHLNCLSELGRYDEAHAIIERLYQKGQPRLEELLTEIADVLNSDKGGSKAAYEFIMLALEFYPQNIQLKVELCIYYELAQKIDMASALCKILLDEDPYAADLWFMQGRLLYVSEKYEEAVESLDFALTCIQDHEIIAKKEIKSLKIFCLYENGSYLKAIETYEDVLSSYGRMDSWHAELLISQAYIQIGDYEKAYQILKRQMNSNPEAKKTLAVYYFFMFCCIKTDRMEEAVKSLGEAVQRFPERLTPSIDSSELDFPFDLSNDEFTEEKNPLLPEDLIKNFVNNNIHYN